MACYQNSNKEKRREAVARSFFDNIITQRTSSFLKLIDDYNVNTVIIPPHCTDKLQPLHLSCNKAAQDYLHSRFRQSYAQELRSQLDRHAENKMIDLRLSVLKLLDVA